MQKMKQSLYYILALALFLTNIYDLIGENKSILIQKKLIDDGYENVRVGNRGNHIYVALEDNHNRGIYKGLAEALKIISPEKSANDTIELVALERQIPQVTIFAIHNGEEWAIETTHGGKFCDLLKDVKPQNSSALKIDIVPYPQIHLSNFRYDRMWCVYSYISPTVEMQLWKGSFLTAQLKIPIWDNYDFGDYNYNKVIPGYVTLSQTILNTSHWNSNITAGLFDDFRDGIIIDGYYHWNNKLDVGAIFGYTGSWNINDNNYFDFKKVNNMLLLGKIEYYEPYTQLQIELQAGQFLYKDKGVRLDVNRHYADRVVGLFCSITDWGTNLGFEFSIPIGAKKMGKHRAIRLRLPETYAYSFNENTNTENDHDANQIGQILHTAPDDNHSAHYWQPEFISKYLKLYLKKSIK